MAQTRLVLRVDQRNEKIAKGLFLMVCLEVDLSQTLESKFRYYRRGKIKSTRIDYEGVLESFFDCGLVDHKFDECLKMEKKIGITIEKKNTYFNDVDGENEIHGERSSNMKESKSWIEVQPNRRTRPLGSKIGYTPIWDKILPKGALLRVRKWITLVLLRLMPLKFWETSLLEVTPKMVLWMIRI